MHSLCLVTGESIDEQLLPFAEYLELDPYKQFLDAGSVAGMAEHYNVSVDDLAMLSSKLRDWSGAEGGLEEGRLFVWSTTNPKAKFDWYEIGGRFDGYLHLIEPVSPGVWQRMTGKPAKARTNQARKGAVKHEPLLVDPPALLLMNGSWYESPLSTDETLLAEWNREFARLFQSIPDDATLTVVDVHS